MFFFSSNNFLFFPFSNRNKKSSPFWTYCFNICGQNKLLSAQCAEQTLKENIAPARYPMICPSFGLHKDLLSNIPAIGSGT